MVARKIALTALLAAIFLGGRVCSQTRRTSAPQKISPGSNALPLTDFYNSPNPLPAGKPGEVIRFEPFDEYRLSYQVTGFRILYHSQSPSGKDVAVSGVVLFPEGTPPAGGWPVIAWAHGFDGAARACAPSLRKNLNEGPLLSMYVGLGYAVVASDYLGLGTSWPHPAMDVRSHAMDVINGVAAARRALPQLSSKWLVAGHAFGTLVAIAVAEAEHEMDDANYLGAIGISGVAVPQEFFQTLPQGPAYAMTVFLAKGIKAVYPEFRVEEMLTAKAMPLYDYVGHSCEVSSGPLPRPHEVLKPAWNQDSYVKQFFTRNALGQTPARNPLLLITGENDPAIPPTLVSSAVALLCEQKDRVLLVQFPALTASAAVENSVSEQLSWIRARFSGLPGPSNCR